MKRAAVVVAMASIVLATAVAAFAAPKLEVQMVATKEKVVIKDGKKTVKKYEAKSIQPGEVVTYTVRYRNVGTSEAKEAELTDPIPEGTAYVPGSASEGGQVGFSIDGGKTYQKASLLTYDIKNPNGSVEKVVASPDRYTNIRWVIDSIPAGASGKVSFQVKVK